MSTTSNRNHSAAAIRTILQQARLAQTTRWDHLGGDLLPPRVRPALTHPLPLWRAFRAASPRAYVGRYARLLHAWCAVFPLPLFGGTHAVVWLRRVLNRVVSWYAGLRSGISVSSGCLHALATGWTPRLCGHVWHPTAMASGSGCPRSRAGTWQCHVWQDSGEERVGFCLCFDSNRVCLGLPG